MFCLYSLHARPPRYRLTVNFTRQTRPLPTKSAHRYSAQPAIHRDQRDITYTVDRVTTGDPPLR
ncbi:hypothetical protein DO72_3749 [Burkholderia pseudomallei]|nr:hypothetical protein DO73_3494 [Burkholderia pseudomallei]KGD39151.1 hypothetical protein DO72_3749 [Burkholderia pseudomallei]